MRGRNGMHWCINPDSPLTSAIRLYIGYLYGAIEKDLVIRYIQTGRLRLIIISAGYGIVDAFEPIHEYDAEMKGQIATHWRTHGLVSVISDFLLNANPSKVIGFFTGDVSWYASGSKYRFFFTEGLKMARREGLETRLSGCFYRQFGKGVKAILSALGRTFIEFMNTDFNEQFALDVFERGRRDGNVVIGFDSV